MSKKAVCISCFHEYDNRIRFVIAQLEEMGYECTYITSDFAHIQKEHFEISLPNAMQIPTKPYYKNLSVERLSSHHFFARDAFRQVEKIDPDLLFTMVPPNSVAQYAARYKKKHPKCKLILDIFDLWPETFPSNRVKKLLALPFSLWGSLRNKALKAADLVTTECSLYHKTLEKYCGKEKLCTLHPAKELPQLEPAVCLPEDSISLCYLGSINNIIDIPRIGQVIAAIGGPVQLHIIGDGERRQELIDTAEAAGAEVTFHGKIYDAAEKQKIFDLCHFGLNIMKDSVCVGLTLKSMDYLAGGLPIINNIPGDTWALVESHGIGINFENDSALPEQALLKPQETRAGIREFFRERFSQEAFLKNVGEILRRLEK